MTMNKAMQLNQRQGKLNVGQGVQMASTMTNSVLRGANMNMNVGQAPAMNGPR
jgi:hypothetical protein